MTNMIPVIRIYLMDLQTVVIIAGPSITILNASKQHIHSKCHILSLKSKYLETLKTNFTGQIIEMSNSTKQHADNSGNHADL